MRRLLVVLALLLPATAGAQIVTEMTPERIKEAIAAGLSEDRAPLSGILTEQMPGAPRPLVCGAFLTPFARVAVAARAAKGKYRTFGPADVTPDDVEPYLLVMAQAKTSSRMDGVRKVKLVVVTPSDSADVADAVHPTHVESRTESFGNAMGARAIGVGVMAKFPLSVLSPENEVRIVYEGSAPECRARFNLAGLR